MATDRSVYQFPEALRRLVASVQPDEYLYLTWTPLQRQGRGVPTRGRIDYSQPMAEHPVDALLCYADQEGWYGWGALNVQVRKLKGQSYEAAREVGGQELPGSGTWHLCIMEPPTVEAELVDSGPSLDDLQAMIDKYAPLVLLARQAFGAMGGGPSAGAAPQPEAGRRPVFRDSDRWPDEIEREGTTWRRVGWDDDGAPIYERAR